MNTGITTLVKSDYPIIDRNPQFATVVGNFSTLDYFRFVTIAEVSFIRMRLGKEWNYHLILHELRPRQSTSDMQEVTAKTTYSEYVWKFFALRVTDT
ncbi:hypothetical protein MLD38_037467 [Melastoma candidum]|uniref:Uncharacterized protein n=1 Tax=Melastoma candidum TaxID=119954 RepID=A0ACB9LN56_9MYRT|nr:hypothetical protein MLD38_037467 [Melastoma candidum]